MTTQEIRTLIKEELPTIIQEDEEIYQFILTLSTQKFANKQETESRFDRVLDELRRDREASEKRWEEQRKLWETNEKRWETNEKRWEGQRKLWEENRKDWQANQQTIQEMLVEIHDMKNQFHSSIGALGARWGLYTEESFRSALRSILVESFGVEVLNITEYDDTGEVFGHPDQIELDIIIQNGILIICEIKSSMSRSDVYTFNRKIKFYERLHNRTASRSIIISPMVDDYARRVAEKFGIEVFSYAEDVTLPQKEVGKK